MPGPTNRGSFPGLPSRTQSPVTSVTSPIGPLRPDSFRAQNFFYISSVSPGERPTEESSPHPRGASEIPSGTKAEEVCNRHRDALPNSPFQEGPTQPQGQESANSCGCQLLQGHLCCRDLPCRDALPCAALTL